MGNEAMRTSRSAGAAIFRRQSTRRRSTGGGHGGGNGGGGALSSAGGASVDDELAVTSVGMNDNNFDTTPKPARRMDKIRRSLSFRKKKKSSQQHTGSSSGANRELQLVSGSSKKNDPSSTIGSDPASSTSTTANNNNNASGGGSSAAPNRPPLWIEDERKVRAGNCSFQVKYLGYQEVSDSRGMPICEAAIEKMLGIKDASSKSSKPIKALLHVSGDSLRVVDESNKTLLVDQTIEKVSFCAPDRHHEEAFAYICRDGTTRRWLCHGFVAIKDTLKGCGPGCSGGERLSHAVGCAFSVCLEKKQKREKINSSASASAGGDTVSIASGSTVTMEMGPNHSFTRLGSFRQASLSERFEDPQIVMPSVEPVPIKAVENPHAIERPKSRLSSGGGGDAAFQRQNSLRMVNPAPFQRAAATYQSLRPGELPSFQQQKGFLNNAAQQLTPTTTKTTLLTHSTSNPISLSSSTTSAATPTVVKSETLNRITEETIAEEPSSSSQVSPNNNSNNVKLSTQLNRQLVIQTATPPNLPPPPSSKSPAQQAAQQQQSKPATPPVVDSTSLLNTTPTVPSTAAATAQSEWASFDPIMNPSASTLFNTPQSLQSSPQQPPILPPLPPGTSVLTTPTIMNPYYQQAANNIMNMTPNMSFVTPTTHHMGTALASPPLSGQSTTSETFEQKWDRIQAAKKTNPFAEDIAKKYEIKL